MSEEKEIASFNTAVAVGDDFFAKRQYMTAEDLMPAFHELNIKCDGIIKEPGIYAIRLQITKMK